jgi:acetolactate synthase-1/2/3 large subunit
LVEVTGAELIEEFLHAQGVRRIYEVSGGMIAPLLDAIDRRGRLRLVGLRHEQAAAFAAEAEGRMTGIPGVALATSGPGAANLLTGIGSCFFDSTPAVFITGQVNRDERRGDRAIRQLGFQELDIVAMARPVTKDAVEVSSPEHLPGCLARAFITALSGRPGPVLIDVPFDVQTAAVTAARPGLVRPTAPHPVASSDVDAALELLANAERPLLLAGNGIRLAGAAAEFRQLVGELGVPVVTSLLGLDLLEDGHPLRVGMLGTYGNRWANLAFGRSDAVLALGSRLDIRQTGSDLAWFARGRELQRVDCDPGELGNRLPTARRMLADAASFVRAALERRAGVRPDRALWLDEIDDLRRSWPDTAELGRCPGVNPNELLRELSVRSSAAAAVVADVGQHQMWAAQSFGLQRGQRWLTSGGMGAMGSGLPLAIGAAFASGRAPVVAIVGDAGLQANLQELQTVVQHGLPIKLVVLNNGCHGLVRQFQGSHFGTRHPSTLRGYSTPSFRAVAEAFGIDALRVEDPAEIVGALGSLWAHPEAPFLLEVAIDVETNVYPKVAFGRPLTEMEPFAVQPRLGASPRDIATA